MTRLLFLLAALCATLLAASAAHAQPPALVPSVAPVKLDDSLYRELGGQPGVDALVADFVPRLATDPHMSEFFKNVNQPHLKQMLSQVFCIVAGGGCTYTGRSIIEVHREMDISKADFNALVEVLQASMNAQHIPFATQNRLLAQLAPMHRDIVTVH
jgi:hemoglobin